MLSTMAFAQVEGQDAQSNQQNVEQGHQRLSLDERALMKIEHMTKTFKLDDKQKAEVLKLNKKMEEELSKFDKKGVRSRNGKKKGDNNSMSSNNKGQKCLKKII